MNDLEKKRNDIIVRNNYFPTFGRIASQMVEYGCYLAESAKCQALVLTGGTALLISSLVPSTAITAYVADPFVSALVETTGALSVVSSEVALEKAVQNYRDEALSYMLKDGIGKSENALQAHLANIAVRKEVYGTAAQRAYAAGDIKSARQYAMKDLLWREQNLWDTRNPIAMEVFNTDEMLSIFTERMNKAAREGNELLAKRYLDQIEKLNWCNF